MLGIDYLEKLKEIGKPQKAEDEKVEFLRERGDLLAQVFEEEIKQPSFNVVIYALSHETLFLKNVISGFNNLKDENNLSPYYIERMDPRELFRSLRLLESDCLWTLFEKIKDQPIMVVEGLKNAVLNNNIEAFLTILSEKGVDTEPITPICRLLYIKVRMDDLQEWMDDIEKHGFRASNKDELNKTAINSLLQYTIEQNQIRQNLCITKTRDSVSAYQHEQMERNIIESSSIMDTDLVSKSGYLVETLVDGLKKEEPTFKGETLTADDFAVLQYKNFIRLYCKFLSRFPDISTCAITVIEGLIKNEAFRHIWSHYETFDEKTADEIENDLKGFLKKHSFPIDEDSQEEDETPTTPQIEESATEEPQPEQLPTADSYQTPRPKLTPEQRNIIKNFYISPNYFKDTSQEEDKSRNTDDHCTITNEKFKAIDAEVRAKTFKAFIKLLAREGCIDPTNEAMQLCAYAFTGIEFKHPFQPGLAKWRQEKVDILLFICTKFYKRNKKSTTNFVKALEVFQVTAEGNRNKKAESVIGTRFDVKFTEAFSDGNTPIRSIFD